MAPIHDSDVAENRWKDSEWQDYELWETLEIRARRRRRRWILGTLGVFLALSAVPPTRDRLPRWEGVSSVRRLAQEIGRLKVEAGIRRQAFRIRFDSGLHYSVIRSNTCSDPRGEPERSGELGGEQLALLSQEQGDKLGIPGLTLEYCYDYLSGGEAILRGETAVGFGVIPVKDLAEGRTDRIALLLLSGTSATASFE